MIFGIDSNLLAAIAIIIIGPSLIMIEGAWSRARTRKRLATLRAERIEFERELKERQEQAVET